MTASYWALYFEVLGDYDQAALCRTIEVGRLKHLIEIGCPVPHGKQWLIGSMRRLQSNRRALFDQAACDRIDDQIRKLRRKRIRINDKVALGALLNSLVPGNGPRTFSALVLPTVDLAGTTE